MVPETKNKTLEELDVYFGGDSATIAAQDRERMQRIEASLGLAGVQAPEDLLAEKQASPASEHDDEPQMAQV